MTQSNLHLDRKFPVKATYVRRSDRHSDRGLQLSLTREHKYRNPQWSRITRETAVG